MTHPLDGCFLKLDRAGAHLAALEEVVREVAGPEPDSLPGELDHAGGRHLFRAQRDRRTPLALSAIVGDAVHNLFTALDYLAWELAVLHRGSGDTWTAFPIFEDREKYQEEAPKKVRRLHSDAQALVERVQPFQVPQAKQHRSEHPLARLYALEQRDKHRTLNLTTISASGRLCGLPPHIHTPPGYSGFPRGSYERGEVLASLSGFASDPPPRVALEVIHEVAFAEGGPAAGQEVLGTLGGIVQHVRLVVSRFERFFPSRV